MWENSSGHRANMLNNNFSLAGISIILDTSNGRKYGTQIFAA